jgi:hypothetical protein
MEFHDSRFSVATIWNCLKIRHRRIVLVHPVGWNHPAGPGATGLGTAVKFIPRPVVVGFTNGIAVIKSAFRLLFFLSKRVLVGEIRHRDHWYPGVVQVLLLRFSVSSRRAFFSIAVLEGFFSPRNLMKMKRVGSVTPPTSFFLSGRNTRSGEGAGSRARSLRVHRSDSRDP